LINALGWQQFIDDLHLPWVALTRLPAGEARQVVDQYVKLFLQPVIDQKTGQQKLHKNGQPMWRNRSAQLRKIFNAAYRRYRKVVPRNLRSPRGFREYLLSIPGEQAAARQMRQLQTLLRDILSLGLTPGEFMPSVDTLMYQVHFGPYGRTELREFILNHQLRAAAGAMWGESTAQVNHAVHGTG
jgi:hypothetical protein